MVDEYNAEWCKEKHGYIDKAFEKHDRRIKKVENRFLAMMTILVANLLGIIGTLTVLLIKLKGG